MYFGAPTAVTGTTDLAAMEDAYMAANGKPLQVRPDGTLPSYESGTVLQKLGKTVPAGYRVDTYLTPKGEWGYTIASPDGAVHNYGPETYREQAAPPKSATST